MNNNFKRLIKFSFLFVIFFNTFALSIVNKIVLKIDNITITTVDVLDEMKYLQALNPSLKSLDKKKIIEIAKNSLIRETIKIIEISKFNISSVNQKYLDSLIKSIYTNIGLKNKEEFITYINTFGIDIKTIEKKLLSETHWNQLIYNKFFSKLKIDKNKIKKEILTTRQKSISYQLYEIVYNIDQNTKSEELFKDIKKSILENGFENTAAIFSITESSKTGGNLGWVNENTINKKILKEISIVNIGQHTKPILIPGGFLILKVKDKKEIKNKIDIDKELSLRTKLIQNQQLNQYSNIYFNKIKKDFFINEK